MTQSDFGTIDPDTKGGAELATDLNGFRDAQNTNHAGTAQPSYVVTYMTWLDTDESLGPTLKLYDGTDDIPIWRVDTTNNVPLLPNGTRIVEAASGQTAGANADNLVIDSSGNTGLSIFSGNTSFGSIYFGDTDSATASQIVVSHSAGRFNINAETDFKISAAGSDAYLAAAGKHTWYEAGAAVMELDGGDLYHVDYDSSSATGQGWKAFNTGLFAIQRPNTAADSTNVLTYYRGTTLELIAKADGDLQNTNNSYGAISDERLKKNITPALSQWDDVLAMKLVNYQLDRGAEQDTDTVLLGLVAQQLQAAGMGGLVSENENGTLGVKYSVAMLKVLGALQEAMERIEALEAAQ